MPTVIRDRPNSEPNYRKLSLTHPRPEKSYIGAIYICVSRSTPPDILNLIFNARTRSQPSSSLLGLLGGQRESFIMRVPQEAHSWISSQFG